MDPIPSTSFNNDDEKTSSSYNDNDIFFEEGSTDEEDYDDPFNFDNLNDDFQNEDEDDEDEEDLESILKLLEKDDEKIENIKRDFADYDHDHDDILKTQQKNIDLEINYKKIKRMKLLDHNHDDDHHNEKKKRKRNIIHEDFQNIDGHNPKTMRLELKKFCDKNYTLNRKSDLTLKKNHHQQQQQKKKMKNHHHHHQKNSVKIREDLVKQFNENVIKESDFLQMETDEDFEKEFNNIWEMLNQQASKKEQKIISENSDIIQFIVIVFLLKIFHQSRLINNSQMNSFTYVNEVVGKIIEMSDHINRINRNEKIAKDCLRISIIVFCMKLLKDNVLSRIRVPKIHLHVCIITGLLVINHEKQMFLNLKPIKNSPIKTRHRKIKEIFDTEFCQFIDKLKSPILKDCIQSINNPNFFVLKYISKLNLNENSTLRAKVSRIINKYDFLYNNMQKKPKNLALGILCYILNINDEGLKNSTISFIKQSHIDYIRNHKSSSIFDRKTDTSRFNLLLSMLEETPFDFLPLFDNNNYRVNGDDMFHDSVPMSYINNIHQTLYKDFYSLEHDKIFKNRALKEYLDLKYMMNHSQKKMVGNRLVLGPTENIIRRMRNVEEFVNS